MEKEKTISVVVPVYNNAPYLDRCLTSLVSQTLPLKEIICIDDGSTDGSSEILDTYKEKYNNLVVIHQENRGVSVARNRGIDLASAKYIGFVDADDYVDPEMYEVLLQEALESSSDISMVIQWVEQENGEKHPSCKHHAHLVLDRKAAIHEMMKGRYFAYGVMCDCLFRRDLFNHPDQVRYPEGWKDAEDQCIKTKLFCRAKRVTFTSRPLYHYVQHPESASHARRDWIGNSVKASYVMEDLIREISPESIKYIRSARALSALGEYDRILKYGIKNLEKEKDSLACDVRKNIWPVLLNPYIALKKKCQFLLLGMSRRWYDAVFTQLVSGKES